jgi:hypothetical protein
MKLDKITSAETDEKELLFEKTKFLSFLFTGIPEDELLFLAGVMKYMKSIPEKLSPFADGSIIWAILPGKSDPEVVIVTNGETEEFDSQRFTGENISFYILEMEAVDAFYHLYPEHAFEIMKFIDENEK